MKDEYYPQYRDFGITVLYYRRKKGYSQEFLAEKMGITTETLSRIENANTGLSMDTLLKLSKALETPLSELFEHAKL